jgi:OOP family OmpA-OmpF porin
MFAPFQEVLAPETYDSATMEAAIQRIPDKQGIFGRMTPMGLGIDQLGPVLAGLSGSTAILMLSDGEHNIGALPALTARSLLNQYPDICFHVISFAQTAEGKRINQEISQVGNNCLLVEGPVLMGNRETLIEFVKEIFCEEIVEEVEEVLILRGIHFDFDKYDIKPEWEPVLDEALQFLNDNPEVRVIIEGHTDAIGSVEYNQRLSERRARSVYNYLLDKGVLADRMSTIGYGKLRPKADNDTEEGRALNRRVEFQVER